MVSVYHVTCILSCDWSVEPLTIDIWSYPLDMLYRNVTKIHARNLEVFQTKITSQQTVTWNLKMFNIFQKIQFFIKKCSLYFLLKNKLPLLDMLYKSISNIWSKSLVAFIPKITSRQTIMCNLKFLKNFHKIHTFIFP